MTTFCMSLSSPPLFHQDWYDKHDAPGKHVHWWLVARLEQCGLPREDAGVALCCPADGRCRYGVFLLDQDPRLDHPVEIFPALRGISFWTRIQGSIPALRGLTRSFSSGPECRAQILHCLA